MPKNTLRFSKKMVVLSVLLIAGGVVLILSTSPYGLMGGVLCAALGFGLFFSAGYYWGCDNESCS